MVAHHVFAGLCFDFISETKQQLFRLAHFHNQLAYFNYKRSCNYTFISSKMAVLQLLSGIPNYFDTATHPFLYRDFECKNHRGILVFHNHFAGNWNFIEHSGCMERDTNY
jgi:hypothetical protein